MLGGNFFIGQVEFRNPFAGEHISDFGGWNERGFIQFNGRRADP